MSLSSKTVATLTFIFAIVVNDAPVFTSDSTDKGFCSRWRRLYSRASNNCDDDVTPQLADCNERTVFMKCVHGWRIRWGVSMAALNMCAPTSTYKLFTVTYSPLRPFPTFVVVVVVFFFFFTPYTFFFINRVNMTISDNSLECLGSTLGSYKGDNCSRYLLVKKKSSWSLNSDYVKSNKFENWICSLGRLNEWFFIEERSW